eukprot:4208078-Alexandrium_andersonii.AAC.1
MGLHPFPAGCSAYASPVERKAAAAIEAGFVHHLQPPGPEAEVAPEAAGSEASEAGASTGAGTPLPGPHACPFLPDVPPWQEEHPATR